MNLNLMASFTMSGYGITGYQVFKALYDRGVNISLFLTHHDPVDWIDKESTDKACRNAVWFDPQAPCLRIYHQFLMAVRIGRGKFIPYTFFELDPLTPLDVHHLNTGDLVLVASHWAKEVCERSGVLPAVAV